MRGVGQGDAVDEVGVPRSARSRSSASPPFAGFFSKDPIIAADLHDHWYGVVFWLVRARRRVPHRPLHVPALLHRLPRRAEPRSCASTTTRITARKGRGRCSCRSACSPCSRPSAAGSSSRRSGSRSRTGSRRSPRRSPSPMPTNCAGGAHLGVIAPSLGLAGIARRVGDLRRAAARGAEAARRSSACSSTSSTSTRLYDAALLPAGRGDRDASARATSRSRSCSPPAPTSARRTLELGERRPPHPDRPAPHLRLLPRRGHGRHRRRLPHRAMNVVLLHNSSSSGCRSARAVAHLDPAALALRDREPRGARLARRGRRSGSSRRRASTSAQSGLQIVAAARRGSRTSDVSYHVGEYGFSLWLVGLTVVAMAAASATASGSGATGRARTSG